MSLWETYLDQVIQTGKTLMIPCADKTQQNSIKTILFRSRSKMPSVVKDLLRISGNTAANGSLFVKVFIQKQPEAFFLEDGVMTPVSLESESYRDRIIRMMKEDGLSDEEIEENLKEEVKEDGSIPVTG